MLKKTMTFVDFDGNERTETFYFNLSKAELIRLEMGETGGLQKFLDKIVSEVDNSKIYNMFEKIVIMSYGEKSLDGKRFMKTDEIRQAFMDTNAYSDLIVELVSNAEAAANFINAVIPHDLAEQAAKEAKDLKKLPE